MAFKAVATVTNRIESEQYCFEDKGDMLEGYLIDRARLTSKDTGKEFWKYVVQTNEGNYSFLGGYQLDKVLPTLEIGTMVRITYTGKQKLGGGKSLKTFSIEVDEDDVLNAAGAAQTAADVIRNAKASA